MKMLASLAGAGLIALAAAGPAAADYRGFGSLGAETASPIVEIQAGQTMSVRVKSAVLRADASKSSKKLGTLRRGAKVQVVGTSGEWTQVRSGKRTGYVSTALLQ